MSFNFGPGTHRVITIAILGIFFLGFNPMPTSKEIDEKIDTHALVDSFSGSVPRNRILLIRRKESFCALQFTSFRRAKRELGSFEAGLPVELYGEYDWYFTRNINGYFKGAGVESGHDNVFYKPSVGIGFGPNIHGGIGFSRADQMIECGDLTLHWVYPNGIHNVSDKGLAEDPELEYAPTRWQDISQVNANDPSMKWYGPNSNVSNEWIPLEDLPPKNLKKK